MFGSMGMFGAFGCDPEEVAKKNEEMKREAEIRRDMRKIWTSLSQLLSVSLWRSQLRY